MTNHAKTRSLSRRLIYYAILFGLIITLIFSLIELYAGYQHDLADLNDRLTKVETRILPGLNAALWSVDDEQVKLYLASINDLPDIEYVEISVNDQPYISSGSLTSNSKNIQRNYPLHHHQFGRDYDLGQLTIVASQEPIRQKHIKHLGKILIINALTIFLTAFFIVFLFERLVSRHLRYLTSFVKNLPIDEIDKPIVLQRKPSKPGKDDELDILVSASNQLRSKLKRAFEEIKLAENRYHTFIDNSNELIYRVGFREPIDTRLPVDEQCRLIEKHGYFAEWNTTLKTTFNLTDEQMASLPLQQSCSLFDPDNRDGMRNFIESGYRVSDADVSFRDADGKEIITVMNLAGIVDDNQLLDVWGIDTIITERVIAERALQESKTRLSEAQAIAHLGHWERYIHKDEMNWSDEIFRIVGYEPQSFVPTVQRFEELVHPEDRENILTAIRHALVARVTLEFRIFRPDGKQRFIYGTAQPAENENGQTNRLFGIVQDITEAKLLERKSRDQQLQLIQADKMSSLGLMVSGIAHEINNPNNLMQMNASLLQDMWPDARYIFEDYYQTHGDSFTMGGLPYKEAAAAIPELLSGLGVAGRRIQQIINDLKNFTRRGENGNLTLTSVNDCIEASVRLLKPLIKAKTDHLQLELDTDLPAIYTNPQHIEQIVINLLTNALDALPDKQHKVWISSAHNQETNQIEICVRDNGVGISDDDKRYIFDPFYSTKQGEGGTGLGLAIAYNLAVEHNGSLAFFSEESHGSVFTLSLPVIDSV